MQISGESLDISREGTFSWNSQFRMCNPRFAVCSSSCTWQQSQIVAQRSVKRIGSNLAIDNRVRERGRLSRRGNHTASLTFPLDLTTGKQTCGGDLGRRLRPLLFSTAKPSSDLFLSAHISARVKVYNGDGEISRWIHIPYIAARSTGCFVRCAWCSQDLSLDAQYDGML